MDRRGRELVAVFEETVPLQWEGVDRGRKKGARNRHSLVTATGKRTGPMVVIQDSGVDNNMLKSRHRLGVQHIRQMRDGSKLEDWLVDCECMR